MVTPRRRLAVGIVVVLAVLALASRAFLAKDTPDARFRTEPAPRGALVMADTYVSGPVQAIDARVNLLFFGYLPQL